MLFQANFISEQLWRTEEIFVNTFSSLQLNFHSEMGFVWESEQLGVHFFNTQKQLPLFSICPYAMADRQDERPLCSAWQKHWLSQSVPAVHHLSGSLIWLSLSHQRNSLSLKKQTKIPT